jgi:hypothetical protein
MNLIIPDSGYYVYTLAYPDGKIFYIGKGKGERIHQHLAEARNQCQCRKCHIIRAIWRAGHEIKQAIVFTSDNEDLAYAHEALLISQHQRLVNIAQGGRGGGNHIEYRKPPKKQQQIQPKLERRQKRHAAILEMLGYGCIGYDNTSR